MRDKLFCWVAYMISAKIFSPNLLPLSCVISCLNHGEGRIQEPYSCTAVYLYIYRFGTIKEAIILNNAG